MAFNVVATIAAGITTVKDPETVSVQVVEITNLKGEVIRRVEARIMVNNPGNGYVGPTKTALVFDDADDITSLVKALEAARDTFLGMVTPVAAPVVKQARQKRAAAPRAAKVA